MNKRSRLTFVKYSHHSKHGQRYNIYRCECGKEKAIMEYSVRIFTTISCGCSRARHGQSQNNRTYRSWQCMLQRCFNKNFHGYEHYGGRGITVCKRWRKFENFFEDMGKRPLNTTLDRVANNESYTPNNCRWADRKTQANNTRRNKILTLNGQSRTVSEWAVHLSINVHTLFTRLRRGWTVERALNEKLHV